LVDLLSHFLDLGGVILLVNGDEALCELLEQFYVVFELVKLSME
jgi:hypothetical protein